MRSLQLAAAVVIVCLFACNTDSNDLLAPQRPAGPMASIGIDPVSGATIETDQDDYLPGQLVHVTGTGWAPNETVHLFMTEDPDTHGDVEQDVVADSLGAFSVPFYDVQEHDLGVTFTLTATGQSSGSSATAMFTDSRAVNSYTLNGTTFTFPPSPPSAPASNPITVSAGSSVSVVASVSTTGTAGGSGAGNSQWLSTSVEVKLNPSGSFTQIKCDETDVNTGGAGTFSHTFTFAAPGAGTYDVRLRAWAANSCSANPGDKTYIGAMTVTAQANQTISFGALGDKTYGDAAFSVSATASSGLAVSFSGLTPTTCNVTGSTVTILHTGICTVRASQAGDANYNQAPDIDQSFTIAKATASITVTGYAGVYDGAPHGAAGSAMGVNGENLSGLLSLGASFTDVPGGSALWTFAGDDNYNSAGGAVAITITRAASATAVHALTVTYDGNAHPTTFLVTGVGTGITQNVTWNYSGACAAAPVNVADTPCTASATYAGDLNHSASSGSNTITIIKASSATTVTFEVGPFVYRGTAFTATAAATGAGGLNQAVAVDYSGDCVNVTGTDGCTATATYGGDGNHEGSSDSESITIEKANAIITVNGYTGAYDAQAHRATGSAAGVLAEDLSGQLHLGASFTNVPGGTAHWTFDGNGNYNSAEGDVAITIHKANASITVNGYTGVYDAQAHGATGSAAGVIAEDLSSLLHLGASFTDVPGGTAHWSFDGNGNYNSDEGEVAITITKATASITVHGYTGIFDGLAHGASGSAVGVIGEDLGSLLDFGASFTNVPGGTAHWTFNAGGTNGNYNLASGDVAITILAWTLKGFYQPVDMPIPTTVWNTVKNGSTVPLKFEIFAGSVERTDVGAVKSFVATKVACDASSPVDDLEFTTTGGTSLRYDAVGGQFIQNWQTPKLVGQCYQVTMRALDNSTLVAYFKLK